MLIRDAQIQEVESVRQFLCANGWAHRVGSPETFALLLAHSQRTAVAVVDHEIVGFARAITDGISNGYLSMVVVSQEHRLQGIGRALVEHIAGDDPRITWVLRAGREGATGPNFSVEMLQPARMRAMDQYSQSDLVDDLAKVFPEFASYWQTDIAGDEFPSTSLHSVYMSFLPFLSRANPTPKQWKRLADHFSEAVAAGGDRENAADTCFLEGLGKGDIARMLRPLLSKEAKSYI